MALVAASLLLATASLCAFFFTPRALGLRLPWRNTRSQTAALSASREQHDSPAHPPIVVAPASDQDGQPSTPKATPSDDSRLPPSTASVPSIALAAPDTLEPAQAPTAAQAASQLMPPPPAPPPKSPKRAAAAAGRSSDGTHLTAPPVPLPKRSGSLRAATSAASTPSNRTASLAPNPRAPPQRLSSAAAATSSTLPLPKRPRQKVVLAPGHSPLDWAQLTATTPASQMAGVPTLQRVTPTLLKSMNGRKGAPAWSAFGGKVYNIGPYLPFHPGGEGELKRGAGKIGDKLFDEVHPWVNVDNMLRGCLVGILVGETDTAGASELEDMD